MATEDIKRLTALEEQWLRRQHKTIHQSGSLRGQTGVHATWQGIFREYALLGGRDLEALKRALYLCWTERSQDPLLSGVKDLDPGVVREVFVIADELARADGLDAELRWMLPYYYLVEPSYLDRSDDLDDLKRVSKQNPLLYRQECLKGSFENRGHMGHYWKAKQAILHKWP